MTNVTQTARSLLMVAVMIASAILPMAPEATELRDDAKEMRAMLSTNQVALSIDEGDEGWYEISLDEAPDGVLVITPSGPSNVEISPSYLKFTKLNWEWNQTVWVHVLEDDDGVNSTGTITHALSGTDAVYANEALADVGITSVDHDTDTDGDGLHDGLDDDDDGDLTLDDADEFPLDGSEDTDTDGDGTGDNADVDDDGDGTNDTDDAFPLDASEDTDTDGDGTGDNADIDDDGDGVNDTDEESGCDLLADCDGDLIGDATDDFDNDASEDTDT
ncbi:MAG: hypothetical protein CL414_04900, partial [Acidimicrobiaceae bacterium]|nr:hypothetical protein [Acidimicrobiaceae bacterium]